jgi:hypothetical protein
MHFIIYIFHYIFYIHHFILLTWYEENLWVPQTCHGPLFFHSSTSDMSWTIVFSFKYLRHVMNHCFFIQVPQTYHGPLFFHSSTSEYLNEKTMVHDMSEVLEWKNNGSWHVWGTWMKKQWFMTCLRYLNEKTMVHDMSWTIVFSFKYLRHVMDHCFFIQVPQTYHGPLFFHSSTSDMSWTIVFSFKYLRHVMDLVLSVLFFTPTLPSIIMIISRLIWLSLWKFYVFSTVYKFSNKLYVF